MEEKHNNATQQRPLGARPLDAGIIPINVPRYIEQIKKEDAYLKNGKNAITVFKTDGITITVIALKAGQIIQPGSEEKEAAMCLQLIDGHIAFESLDKKLHLRNGELLTLHQQLSFKVVAINDSVCLLTMLK